MSGKTEDGFHKGHAQIKNLKNASRFNNRDAFRRGV
jgi:hypothetical protein